MKRLILSVSLITVVSLQAMDGGQPKPDPAGISTQAAGTGNAELIAAVRELIEQVRREADLRNEQVTLKLLTADPGYCFQGENGAREIIDPVVANKVLRAMFAKRGMLQPLPSQDCAPGGSSE